eukprot:gene25867-biopygen17861
MSRGGCSTGLELE